MSRAACRDWARTRRALIWTSLTGYTVQMSVTAGYLVKFGLSGSMGSPFWQAAWGALAVAFLSGMAWIFLTARVKRRARRG